MKVYKKKELSLQVTPFGMAGKQYLSFAVMVFFDLTAPDDPLTDQDLWRDAPGQLGPVPILDTGMPKPRAEFLVAGSCFAPRGRVVPASRVRVRVGDVHKTLNVLGDRFFLPDGDISEPRPFSEMPVTFENAFGGEGFAQNPLGKGMVPVAVPGGPALRALPNIEHPSRMVGGPDDRPDPAGLRMLDVTWPPRSHKTGTYDARWLAERWPDFPDDMDHAFFNAGQPDQWAQGFFQGDETIEIEGMHPDMPRIDSRLPGIRVRLFPTLIKNFKRFQDKSRFTEEFTEVAARIDTVWLFPGILRGLCIFRGSVANSDDEYYDLTRVFLDFERLSEPPLPMEEYLERQKKAMDLTVPVDMAPFEAAAKDIAAAVKTLKNAPKEAARIKKAILGQEPAMPRSPDEVVRMGEAVAAGNLKTIDDLEKVARDLHRQFGHMTKIDLGLFDAMRGKVAKAMDSARQTAAKVNAGLAKAQAAKAAILAKANAEMEKMTSDERIASFGLDRPHAAKFLDLDMRFSMPDGTGNPWHDEGFPLVVACRRALENDAEAKDALRRLGLSDRTVRRAWIGINAEARREDPVAWGLAQPPARDRPAPPPIDIPAGLVLPRFDGPTLNRILVRADVADRDYTRHASDVLVPGSAEVPLALAPAEPGGYYLCVADELQALFMEQEVGDACGVVALADPGQAPDADTAKAIAAKDIFLVILPEGITTASPQWEPWAAAYKNARLLALPKGRTVFEAGKLGLDIRRLVMEALPPQFAAWHSIEPELPEAGKAPTASPVPPLRFPNFDFAGDAAAMRATLEARMQPEKDRLLAMQADLDDKFAAAVAKSGKTMDTVAAAAKAEAAMTPREKYARTIKLMEAEKKRIQDAGIMSPDMEKKMDDALAKIRGVTDDAAARYDREMARIAQGRKTLDAAKERVASRIIPGMTRAEMDAAGLDPDLLRPMTVAEVVARYEAGLSFARRTLSGLDLSGLALPGIDLSEAILEGTRLVKTDLTGAKLKKAIAKDADFTKASLVEADLEMTVLTGARLKKADLTGARLRQTLLQQADLTKASLVEATLDMTVIQDCKLAKADFRDALVKLTLIHASDMPKADFRSARLQKTMVRMLDCSKACFDGASVNDVMFHAATGEAVSFKRADLTRLRSGHDTKLPGADFRGAKLNEACLRETALPGADFTGADLSGALFELCDLTRANLRNVPARGASLLKCDLAAADMRGLDLMTGSLRKSRLTQADLRQANLYGVDFLKIIVGDTNFQGANLKMTMLHKRTDLLA